MLLKGKKRRNKTEVTEGGELNVAYAECVSSAVICGVEVIREDEGRIVITGHVKGDLIKGDRLRLINPGDDDHSYEEAETGTVSVVDIIDNDGVHVPIAKDCIVDLVLSDVEGVLRKGSILAGTGCDAKEINSYYINTIGETFVKRQDLIFTEEDIKNATITDIAESLRLYNWYMRKTKPTPDEETVKMVASRQAAAVKLLLRKVKVADHIYYLKSNVTGEAYVKSIVTQAQDGKIMILPGFIIIGTARQEMSVMKAFAGADCDYVRVDNDREKTALAEFLYKNCILNGVAAVGVGSPDSLISDAFIKEECSFGNNASGTKPSQGTNPSLVRWILQLVQMGTPESDDDKRNAGIFNNCMKNELKKSTFLVPVREDKEKTPEQKTDHNSVEVATVMDGDGHLCVKAYTDYRFLCEDCGDNVKAVVLSLRDIAKVGGIAINPVKDRKLTCIIKQDKCNEIVNEA